MHPGLVPLLREIGDLKRVTSAGRPGSIAERAFRQAWSDLLSGLPAGAVALKVTAACLAATRLGDLDAVALLPLGVPAEEIGRMRREALTKIAPVLAADRLGRLVEACDPPSDAGPTRQPPPFVSALADQPRAGATCPGRARIVLLPPENHAEHCLVVAVYAVLLAEPGCDLGTAFLASLAHHLHNAAIPDAGFTGETLLGGHLEPAMRAATALALAELPPALAAETERAREILPDAATPEGRAFHAADVLDRVLEIEQHVRRGQVTMEEVLGPMALVHKGPVKPFHDRVLAEMGLG